MEIRLAYDEEISLLTQISKEAFDTDINVGGSEIGGPPNYDSKAWHRKMQKCNNLYSIIVDEQLVGGMILLHDRKEKNIMYVGRIFIDAKCHRKGYGMQAMKLIEQYFESITILRLETPDWNIRTNQFYKKAGYQEMGTADGSVYYQKVL